MGGELADGLSEVSFVHDVVSVEHAPCFVTRQPHRAVRIHRLISIPCKEFPDLSVEASRHS